MEDQKKPHVQATTVTEHSARGPSHTWSNSTSKKDYLAFDGPVRLANRSYTLVKMFGDEVPLHEGDAVSHHCDVHGTGFLPAASRSSGVITCPT